MDPLDVVNQWLAAVEAGDWNTAASLLAEDMVFEGPVPEPVGKAQFVGLQSALVAGIPDWSFNPTDISAQGDQVFLTNHISGTQTGTLNLPMLPAPIPPTGRSFQLGAEPVVVTIRDGLVTRISAQSGPQGGVMGILMQLGVELPPMM